MKTYVFKLSGPNIVRHYAATAANQSEAAQVVCGVIGGHTFATMLDYAKEYATPHMAKSAAAKVIFCN